MDWIAVLIVLVVIGALIHLALETFYFLRVAICYILAKFIKKKIHILEKCSLSGKQNVKAFGV